MLEELYAAKEMLVRVFEADSHSPFAGFYIFNSPMVLWLFLPLELNQRLIHW